MRRHKTEPGAVELNRQFEVTIISLLVGAYGVYLVADTLLRVLMRHHHDRISSLFVDLPLLIGLSVIYLSTLLKRRKKTAWLITICAYTFYMALGVTQVLTRARYDHTRWWLEILRYVVVPLLLLALLVKTRGDFVVGSDIRGFRASLKFVVIILIVTLMYGVVGFTVMDTSDFHQEIDFGQAVHYTVDQFNLTTNKPAHPYTRRASLFVDSLSFISVITLIYVALALFQPIRSRFSDQSHARQHVERLLNQYGAECEEFFKLWPHDKQYYFDDTGQSAIAFHVYRGVALCLSDPVGNPARFKPLMAGFLNLCFHNDWLPSLVHVSDHHLELYARSGFTMQKLGQEAVVDIEHFQANLRGDKYFRQIMNKFNKQGYSFELLSPPHHHAIQDRLQAISTEWLSKGSRSERGFAMGYYTQEYIQICQVAVARDAAGTIQAFANLVPAPFDHKEATYDMIRQSQAALSNVTDYLIINIIEGLHQNGYSRFNMGLSPLAGLDETDSEERTILDNVLKFVYANGDTFFSFSGLHRFKSKYEPKWQDKYVGFKGGIRGFSRTMTALTRCMSKVVKL